MQPRIGRDNKDYFSNLGLQIGSVFEAAQFYFLEKNHEFRARPANQTAVRERRSPIYYDDYPTHYDRGGYGGYEDYHTSYSDHGDTYISHHGSYGSSGYDDGPCCPLVVDPFFLATLLGVIAAATYFLRVAITMNIMADRRRKRSLDQAMKLGEISSSKSTLRHFAENFTRNFNCSCTL